MIILFKTEPIKGVFEMSTISDVAKLAGVSAMTVSRVINRKGYISDETRQAVEEAISLLNYRPNLVARTLASGSSGTLGLLCTHIKNPIYARYIDYLCQKIKNNNRDLILYMAKDTPSLQKGVNTLEAKQVDGIAVLPIELTDTNASDVAYHSMLDSLYQQARASQKPFVFLGPFVESGYPCVYEDYTTGAHIATKYLMELGHKKIAYLAGNSVGGYPWIEREQGYLNALSENGLEPHGKITAKPDLEDAREAVLDYIQRNKDNLPTAIYCASDILAVGAVHALHEMNIRIPDEISVVGHDDGPFARSCYPPLTTLAISPKDTAEAAADMLLSLLDGNAIQEKEKIRPMTPHLRIRKSSGPVKKE